MFSKRFKTFISTIVLLSFIGQANAATNVSCEMMNTDMPDMHVATMMDMDHSMHAMVIPVTDTAEMDCCDDALCQMSSCSGSFSIFSNKSLTLSVLSAELDAQYSFALLDLDTLRLFRPPITH